MHHSRCQAYVKLRLNVESDHDFHSFSWQKTPRPEGQMPLAYPSLLHELEPAQVALFDVNCVYAPVLFLDTQRFGHLNLPHVALYWR